MQWDTNTIVQQLTQHLQKQFPNIDVLLETYGREDYTTDTILIKLASNEDEWVRIRGFSTDVLPNRQVVDVPMVELVDCEADSLGGCQSTNPDLRQIGLATELWLRSHGANVVKNSDDYF